MPDFYVPTLQEVENILWRHRLPDMPTIYDEVAAIVTNINQHLATGRRLTLTTEGRAYDIDLFNQPPRCYCRQFQQDPHMEPRGVKTLIEHGPTGITTHFAPRDWVPTCLHILAWRTYRNLLTEHWQTDRQAWPQLHPYERWLASRYELPTTQLLIYAKEKPCKQP